VPKRVERNSVHLSSVYSSACNVGFLSHQHLLPWWRMTATLIPLIYMSVWDAQGQLYINPLTPNDHYIGHTAPLTSKVAFYIFIQQI
jgi:hypothetical protein